MKPLVATLGVLAVLGPLALLALRPHDGGDETVEAKTRLATRTPFATRDTPRLRVDRARAEEDEPPPLVDAAGAWAAARGALDSALTSMYAQEPDSRAPRVAALRLEGIGPTQAVAIALVEAEARLYPLSILLERTTTGWRAVELRP